MAKEIHKNRGITVDGHEIGDHCFSISTPSEKERVDVSGFNAANTREYLTGTRSDEIRFGVRQDFAAASVHDILVDIYQNDTEVDVFVKPDAAAAVSATNPQFGGPAKLFSYNGLDGQLGEASNIEVVFLPTDSGFSWSNT